MFEPDHLPRREFAWKLLGGIGAASLVGELSAAPMTPPPPALPEDPREKPSDSPPTELQLLTALVQRYPSEHYTEDVLRGIYGDIAGDLSRGRLLRSVPLTNGDEPATVFRVFRADPVELEPIP